MPAVRAGVFNAVGPSITMAQLPDDCRQAAGLQLRPPRETARDTLAWAESLDGEPPASVSTLAPDDEARCLARTSHRRLL